MNRAVQPSACAAVLLTGLLTLAGCGGTPADGTPPPAPLGTASIAPTALPTGWPAVAFPDGTSILSSETGTVDGAPRLAVTFETQELPRAVAAFLDKQLTGTGLTSGGTSTDSSGSTTVRYSGNGRTATLEITDATTSTEGSLVIVAAAASAGPSP